MLSEENEKIAQARSQNSCIASVIMKLVWWGIEIGSFLLTFRTGKAQGLKVHKHEIFFLTFFAETETIWYQGPVTRDF